jgi:hypothetical protein
MTDHESHSGPRVNLILTRQLILLKIFIRSLDLCASLKNHDLEQFLYVNQLAEKFIQLGFLSRVQARAAEL